MSHKLDKVITVSKKFDKAIEKAEQYFGDFIVEYGQNDGADEEQVCSGKWEPDKDTIKSAMGDALYDFSGLTGDELRKCIDYWFYRDYKGE